MSAVDTSALYSIQRYTVAGIFIAALVTLGIGGWASTAELSGAVVGQGSIIVD